MTFALTLRGFGFTLLAGAVTYLGWRNGKITRENTTQILQKMDEGFRILGEKIDEGFRKMDEGFRLIALLILAETPEEKKELAKRILEK